MKAQPDRPPQVLALDGAREARPERALGGRQAQPGRGEGPLAMERGDQPDLHRRGRGARHRAVHLRRVRPASRGRVPGGRTRDPPQVDRGVRPLTQDPARLAHHVPHGTRADRGELEPQVLGERRKKPPPSRASR